MSQLWWLQRNGRRMVIKRNAYTCGLSPHLYADDVQVYGSCSPAAVDAFSTKISDCAEDIADWARSNRLTLNPRLLASQSPRRGLSVISAFTSTHTCHSPVAGPITLFGLFVRSLLRAGVQPTLDPSAETCMSVQCASPGRGGELVGVCGVCASCVGWRKG